MFRYAQLDAGGYIRGISNLSGEVDAPDMILLGESEEVTTGMKRVGEAWEPDDRPAPPPGPDLVAEINQLKADKEALAQQLAQVNGNLAGFIDQYYIDNPDKA